MERRKKSISLLCVILLGCLFIGGCLQKQEAASENVLEDGVYLADFHTDSGMFHVNEACEGKGRLTVKDGSMQIHVSLVSKNIIGLFPGSAKDAEKDEVHMIAPVTDTVTYSDGMTEEVYGFDIPVLVLDEEFDLAILGTKGKWYDHKVSVSGPEPIETEGKERKESRMEDGTYTVEVALEGGSGKASVISPAKLVSDGGETVVTICFSSPYYDYVKIKDEIYKPINKEGNSTFEIPVTAFEKELPVMADTTAMGTPHEISYVLVFQWDSVKRQETEGIPEYISSMELDYAEQFTVDYYKGGSALITISDGSRFFVVPRGQPIPSGLDRDIRVLKQPVTDIYLAGSAVMALFCSLDGLDAIRLSGIREDGWYLEEAKRAMAEGKISYAGKYNAPDYEKILDSQCSLAIESTMILHAPQVKEELEHLGIPVLVDYSSYEKHPLGRTEWVKLYGLLLGKEEKAKKAFEAQKKILESVVSEEKTGKTVAFFYVTSNGAVNVRKPGDYIPQMIELAGGRYVFSKAGEEKETSFTVNMQMEEFYAYAGDADYLIYNSTIDGGVDSLEELLVKSPLLKDFRAVKEGHVFCARQNIYQDSMMLGAFVRDIHKMLTMEEGRDEVLEFLFPLE